jgi:hypothetical protein
MLGLQAQTYSLKGTIIDAGKFHLPTTSVDSAREWMRRNTRKCTETRKATSQEAFYEV